jgi:SlyX protein
MEERIIELESRVAFQEETLHNLSQLVNRHQQVIDNLKLEIQGLQQRLKSLSVSPLDRDANEEPPPPHY